MRKRVEKPKTGLLQDLNLQPHEMRSVGFESGVARSALFVSKGFDRVQPGGFVSRVKSAENAGVVVEVEPVRGFRGTTRGSWQIAGFVET